MVEGVGKIGEMVFFSSPKSRPSETFSSPVIRYSNMPTEMARRSLDSTSVATASAPFKHIVPVGVVVTTMSIGRRVVILNEVSVQSASACTCKRHVRAMGYFLFQKEDSVSEGAN